MPSLLDHLASGDGVDPSTVPDGDLIDSVKAEGRRRRANRHRRTLAVALLGLALVALPAVALRPGGEAPRREVSVATEGGEPAYVEPVPEVSTTIPDTIPLPPVAGPTDTPLPTEPTPPTAVAATTTAPPATAAPPAAVNPTRTPPPVAATTTTTRLVCRNSAHPSCGQFRWDPAPSPNQPLAASFVQPATRATVGDTVTFAVTWSDADARLSFDNFTTDGTVLVNSCSLAPRYGPWTPPAAVGGSGTLRYTHTFTEAKVYEVNVGLSTANCTSPYGNDAVVTTRIEVTARA